MANITQGMSPTTTDTTAQFPLGTVADDPRSMTFANNQIRYVKAGAAITAGDAVRIDYANADEPWVVQPVGSATHVIAGIAHVAIASGSFGWITIKGRVAAARIGSAVTAGAILTATEVTTTADAGELVVLTFGTAFSSTVGEQLKAASAGIGVIAIDSASTSDTVLEVMLQ